jgi:bacterioferritin (cytochrome b1)
MALAPFAPSLRLRGEKYVMKQRIATLPNARLRNASESAPTRYVYVSSPSHGILLPRSTGTPTEESVMKITPQELAILNGYCACALYTARLLGQMLRRAQDLRLRLEMAKQANDALRHAEIWAETIRALGGRPQATSAGFQTRYETHAGRPDNLLQTLVLTQHFERRLARQLVRHFHRSGLQPILRATLRRMVEEELRPEWTTRWLSDASNAEPRSVQQLQAQYAEADAAIGDLFALPEEQQRAA